MKKIKEFIYFYGFFAGIILILLPIITDILWHGGREWNFVSIGIKGVLVQLSGMLLMLAGGRDAR